MGSDCIGTDANRNFEFAYGGEGQSDSPCSNTFSGSGPASEVEVATTQNFILANKGKIKFFNDVHSYASLVLLPWGYAGDANADLGCNSKNIFDFGHISGRKTKPSSETTSILEHFKF